MMNSVEDTEPQSRRHRTPKSKTPNPGAEDTEPRSRRHRTPKSKTPNPKAEDIEAWGRGIAKILLGCQKANLPEPIIEEAFGGIQITFLKSKDKSVDKSVDKILKLILDNKYITQKELAEKTGLSVRGIEKNIRLLKQQGKIKRIGGRKSGHWEIND